MVCTVGILSSETKVHEKYFVFRHKGTYPASLVNYGGLVAICVNLEFCTTSAQCTSGNKMTSHMFILFYWSCEILLL